MSILSCFGWKEQLFMWALFGLQVVVYFYPDMPHHVIVYHLTVTLSSLNSCMDPVVYCFVTNNFQVIFPLLTSSRPSQHLLHPDLPSIHPSHQPWFVHHLFTVLSLSPQATVRNIFRRAEPEQTSGDIVSMQHSSKASGGVATAVTKNVIMMTKIPASLQRDKLENNHTV